MGRKNTPLEEHTALALRNTQNGAHVPSNVFLPPSMRRAQVFKGTPPDVKAQAARIENEADPVGLLIAIAIGQPIPEFHVNEEGEVSATYDTLPLNNRYRIKVIEYLASQVLGTKDTPKQGSEDVTWAAAIRQAAEAEDE